MISQLLGGLSLREYFGYVFHPSRIVAHRTEADSSVKIALLHHSLRKQAETALKEERHRHSEGIASLTRRTS
jgi:hypothetical protein